MVKAGLTNNLRTPCGGLQKNDVQLVALLLSVGQTILQWCEELV